VRRSAKEVGSSNRGLRPSPRPRRHEGAAEHPCWNLLRCEAIEKRKVHRRDPFLRVHTGLATAAEALQISISKPFYVFSLFWKPTNLAGFRRRLLSHPFFLFVVRVRCPTAQRHCLRYAVQLRPGRALCTAKGFPPRLGVVPGSFFNAIHRATLPLASPGMLIWLFKVGIH
jgi:hypothetical protein